MKLISNTSFGELCKSKEKEFPTRNVYLAWYEEIRTNYDNFLKQPLKLEMVAPCDEDDEILYEPKDYEQRLPNIMTEYNDEIYRYKKAKEKVLFEGFEIFKGTIYMCSVPILKVKDLYQTTIECLIHYEPILTENAVKQIGI